jgi:biopolymer transport protein ExbD
MPIRIQRDDDTAINLTPLIDIVFLLIIFFMVGTRFSELDETERNIQVVVPAVSDVATLTPPPPRKVINVLADGSLTLDREAVTLPQLAARLEAGKAQYQKLGVVVRGDADTRHQHVADVIATCRSLEISDLNIAVRPIVR